jgi:hypothetical protein
MTGNVAQVFLTDEEWVSTLKSVSSAMRADGHLVFEIRDPDYQGWKQWNRSNTFHHVDLPGIGELDTWMDLLEVKLPLVSFRWTFVFRSDGTVMTSDSTLRFWGRDEVSQTLRQSDLVLESVRDAPDRPGRELVFLAKRLEATAELP